MNSAELITALFDAFAGRDVERALALCHRDFEFWPQGTAEAARVAGPYRGRDGMRDYFDDVGRVWRALEVIPDDFRVAGEAVVAFGTATGTRIDGSTLRTSVIWTFKLRDGLLLNARATSTSGD